MSNSRIAIFSGAFVVASVACATPSRNEDGTPQARVELATESDGGDEGAPPGEPGDSDAGTGEAADAGEVCAHPICAAGEALSRTCDPCATSLCAVDPYCCNTAWDATCVGEVLTICGPSTCSAPPRDGGASTCSHPICAAGGPLVSGCEPCAATLCAVDPYCCSVAWDATCVGEVGSVCKQSCN